MSATEAEKAWMGRAIEVARRAWGATHPNPMVGALIVEDGRVAAEGFCARDGGPHAEREALAALGRKPKPGATMIVTLEPCSTEGRTGACTQAILEAGIRRVVVGAIDPNPAHAGKGFAILRAGGVEVVTGVLGDECTDLNLLFNAWITRKTPLLAAKTAMTLDGRTATRAGESRWITGEAARTDVHRWRKLFPAIAVGAGTIARDDPQLTVRLPDEPEKCPIRFVFDGRMRTVTDKRLPRVYTDAFRERTIVVTTVHGGQGYIRKLRSMGVQVWECESPTQRATFGEFRKRCAEAGIVGVYFEGGAQLVSQLVHGKELDYLFAYRAPVFFADEKAKAAFTGLRTDKLTEALRLGEVRHAAFEGGDTLTRGRVVYPDRMSVDADLLA